MCLLNEVILTLSVLSAHRSKIVFKKLKHQNHVDGLSFPQFSQKVENQMHVGKQVTSKCKIMKTMHQFLSLSKRIRTECISASKWQELQLLIQLFNPELVILLSPKR